MPRAYLSLLPLPVLAVLVAFSACSRSHGEEPAVHVIPPAAAFAAAAAPAPLPAPPAGPDAPSDAEVQAFERPVPK